MQNVQKYAGATRAVIRLRADGDQLHFSVHDDGAGFDPATVKKGSGLTNMTDRLDALGGSLALTSTPGQGATLAGSLPVQIDAAIAG
jgi:signal transduction histidine kinase